MPVNPVITRFGLIRHAETEWNQKKRIQGQHDSPITAEGEHQARQWGQVLAQERWDRILVSDTGRSLKTAGLINIDLQIPVVQDSRLREQNWGKWTGKRRSELRKEFARLLAEQEEKGWEFRPSGGEDRNMVFERSQEALEAAVEKWPGAKILVITHEGVIKCLIYRYCGRKFLPTETPLLRSLHLHRLIHDLHGFQIEAINSLSIYNKSDNKK
jgi:broad specificity phosphatase PhoE